MRSGWPPFNFLVGVMCTGKALHWFITPAAQSATSWEQVAVAVQALAGVLLAAIALRQSRPAADSRVTGA